ERLELSEGVVVVAAGDAGRARFDITCAASQYRSPFDLGAVHLFYSTSLPAERIEAPGRALRELLQTAAAAGDPCAQLAEWRRAALAGAPQ
ncbi:MAG: hypothetical protein SF182_28530, partial [Deltaproteobacteria bacterium]|nr:hypothetical protein [Deltaproteobacteria bacterium]